MTTTHPLRLAMVGGGPGAFIGAVHRTAALMDGHFVLVAGAFSSDADRCRERAAEWGVEDSRAYASWQDMLVGEAALPEEQRADVVCIVTPNHLHHEVAIAALDAGFHVACDKPLTTTSERAREVAAAVERSGKLFLLTHNYTGSPMVREARELVAQGEAGPIGTVRKVENTIHVTASIIPGNSGGPLVGPDGNVVAIVTRVYSETLGICINIDHVRKLLDDAMTKTPALTSALTSK